MKMIFAIILLMPIISFCQQDSLIKYSAVIEVPNTNKSELYNRAWHWFDKTFRNSKAVITINDKENGDISGKGIFNTSLTYHWLGTNKLPVSVQFICSVKLKDGKYKYEFSDFEVVEYSTMHGDLGYVSTSTTAPKEWGVVPKKQRDGMYTELKDKIEANVVMLSLSLKKEVTTANDF